MYGDLNLYATSLHLIMYYCSMTSDSRRLVIIVMFCVSLMLCQVVVGN